MDLVNQLAPDLAMGDTLSSVAKALPAASATIAVTFNGEPAGA